MIRAYIIAIGWILANALALAGPQGFHAALARIKAGAGGGAPSGDTLEETFETNPGYDESWTETLSSGSIDEDHATQVPSDGGSMSVEIVGVSSTTFTSFDITDTGEMYGKAQMRNPFETTHDFISMRDGGSARMRVAWISSEVKVYQGSVATTTTDEPTADTWIYMWFYYKASTGADDGITEFEWSTTDTRTGTGDKYVLITNGNTTSDVDNLRLGFAAGESTTIYFDNVYLDSTGYP